MATRAEIITQIEGQVTKILLSSRATTNLGKDIDVEATGGKIEKHGIAVLVTNEEGSVREVVQNIRVEYGSDDAEVGAWLEAPIYKDHVASTESADLLAKFVAIETAVGGEVKISPESLDTLGIKYLVFEAGGTRNVTVTLAGQSITREAI